MNTTPWGSPQPAEPRGVGDQQVLLNVTVAVPVDDDEGDPLFVLVMMALLRAACSSPATSCAAPLIR